MLFYFDCHKFIFVFQEELLADLSEYPRMGTKKTLRKEEISLKYGHFINLQSDFSAIFAMSTDKT